MKATLLFILFATIVSIVHQPNLRIFKPRIKKSDIITDGVTDAAEETTLNAQTFYDNPPEEYKDVKVFFDHDTRFDNLMAILKQQNPNMEEAHNSCIGYVPQVVCYEFVDKLKELM